MKTLTLKVHNHETESFIDHPSNLLGAIARFFCSLAKSKAGEIVKKYETVEVDFEDVNEEITSQIEDIKNYRQCEIERIVIGKEKYRDLIDPYVYTDKEMFVELLKENNYSLYEIPIQIVPWFEGVLVVPKV